MDGLARIVERLVDGGFRPNRQALRPVAARLAEEEAPLRRGVVASALDTITGLGPLEPLLADPAVTDVLVNAPDEIWIERAGALERAEAGFPGDEAVVAMVERLVAPLGLRIDRASPAVDARLPDGSRLHALVPPAAVAGPVVAIRRFSPAVADLSDLVAAGGIDDDGASLLRTLVQSRRNLLVSGGTGAGKTTLLNLLSREIPTGERLVTVEDAAELLPRGHAVRLEARPPNAEGAGEITLRSLVRHALRLRPDRIVVGEVRGPEAFDLVQAMSTGHDGSMGTVHGNGPEEALWRLEVLAATGPDAPPAKAVRRQLWSAIGAVIHVERRDGARVVAEIAEVVEGDLRTLRSW